jgi:DNA gyrase subunit A
MSRYKLTDIQAQAILEMQLQRLTRLEREKIVAEYEELKKTIARLRKILGSDKLIQEIIVEELRKIKEDYADERRTEIRDEEITDIRPEDLIKEEDVAIIHTASGYIKRTGLSSYRFQSRGGKGRKGIDMKPEDVVENLFIASTHSYLLIFTNQGRLYWLKALDVPDVGITGRGKYIHNLVEFQPEEKVQSMVSVKDFPEDQYVVMLSTDGLIKKTSLAAFRNIRRGGILAMTMRKGSELFAAQVTDGKSDIIIGTKKGLALRFSEKDIRPMGRQAAGVKAIRLQKKDEIIGMVVIGKEDKYIFTATEKGYGKKTEISLYPRHHRGGKGVINLKVNEKVGPAIGLVGIGEDELILVTQLGKVIRFKTKELRPLGRATQGVRIIHLEEGDRVCSVAKVRED